VLEDIANTENMDFWMKEGLEELEEVRTEKSNLVTIKEKQRSSEKVFYLHHCNKNHISFPGNCAASVPISTFSDLYSPRKGPHISL
jgi:hypothetical protein